MGQFYSLLSVTEGMKRKADLWQYLMPGIQGTFVLSFLSPTALRSCSLQVLGEHHCWSSPLRQWASCSQFYIKWLRRKNRVIPENVTESEAQWLCQQSGGVDYRAATGIEWEDAGLGLSSRMRMDPRTSIFSASSIWKCNTHTHTPIPLLGQKTKTRNKWDQSP